MEVAKTTAVENFPRIDGDESRLLLLFLKGLKVDMRVNVNEHSGLSGIIHCDCSQQGRSLHDETLIFISRLQPQRLVEARQNPLELVLMPSIPSLHTTCRVFPFSFAGPPMRNYVISHTCYHTTRENGKTFLRRSCEQKIHFVFLHKKSLDSSTFKISNLHIRTESSCHIME